MTKSEAIECVGHELAGKTCQACVSGRTAHIEYRFMLPGKYVALCARCAQDLAVGMLKDVAKLTGISDREALVLGYKIESVMEPFGSNRTTKQESIRDRERARIRREKVIEKLEDETRPLLRIKS